MEWACRGFPGTTTPDEAYLEQTPSPKTSEERPAQSPGRGQRRAELVGGECGYARRVERARELLETGDQSPSSYRKVFQGV